jgi:hypothetical protein
LDIEKAFVPQLEALCRRGAGRFWRGRPFQNGHGRFGFFDASARRGFASERGTPSDVNRGAKQL